MHKTFLAFLILLAFIGAGCGQASPNQLTPTGSSPTVPSQEDIQPSTDPTIPSREEAQPSTGPTIPSQEEAQPSTGPTVPSQEEAQPSTASVTPAQPPTPCPQATPEPFGVEPVISPTDQLSQVINVFIGNGESVTITTQAGTFTGTDDSPFSVNVTLLPNTTNYLKVVAFVRTIRHGDCTYGGYSLTKQLVIQQGGLPPPRVASTFITPDNAAQLEQLGSIFAGGEVSDVIFGSSGDMIVVGSTISHWDVGTWQEINRYGDLGSAAGVGAISLDSSIGATGEFDGVVTWDTTTGASRQMADPEYFRFPRFLSLAFNPGATRLAGGDNQGHVVIWNVATGRLINDIEGDGFEEFFSLHWLDDDILVGAGSEGIYRWDLGTGQLLERLTLPVVQDGEFSYGKEDIAISDNGSRFAAVAGGSVLYWDGKASGWAVWQVPGARFLTQVVFAPGGGLLATVAIGESGLPKDSKLLLWNLNTQELVASLPIGDKDTIRFSPDGRYIAGIGYREPVVNLWGVP